MQSLAIKYRPRAFADVTGQEHVMTILRNQLDTKENKQGYLFTGGAGTGKTTIARIFAKSLNGEVIEIDGASNNGVEHIREIRESSKFKPLSGGYKIYIIDEVHMLTTSAFNALLKTLEEPPAHVIFILATTDPQKIPATILSRVQRFDFKRMTVKQTVQRLEQIIDWECSEIESDSQGTAPDEAYPKVSVAALEYIAKLSHGGMRSAISILDTCLGYKKTISYEDVVSILGSSNYDSYLNILTSIARSDFADIINRVEREHIDGKDLKQFVKGLTEFTVDLMKVVILGNYEYVSFPQLYQQAVDNLIADLGEGGKNLRELFSKLTDLSNSIKYETSPKAIVIGGLLTL